MFRRLGLDRRQCRRQRGRLDLVALGQDDIIADRRAVEHRHHLAVDLLEPVAGIDQHHRALEHRPAAQEIVDQEAPPLDHVSRRLGKAITGHVDQPERQRRADIEEIQLLGPARGVRRPRQLVAVGQRVDQRRLADVRAPGKGDFGHIGRRQMLERRRRLQKLDRPREQFSRAFGLLRPILVHHALAGSGARSRS